MTEPHQRPEGALIEAALRRSNMSARKAAARAGLSDARWRQIVKGYQSAGAGQVVKVHGPAETVARMATAVGVAAEELRRAGRSDAADVMGEPFSSDEAEAATQVLREQLNPDLLRYTDYELVSELHARMVLMASRLHSLGDDTLTFITGTDGENIITARPSMA